MFELKGNPGMLADRLYQSALHGNGFAEEPYAAYRGVHDQPVSAVDPRSNIRWRLMLVCTDRCLAAKRRNLNHSGSLRCGTRPVRFRPLNCGPQPPRDFVVPIVFFAARDLRQLREILRYRGIELVL